LILFLFLLKVEQWFLKGTGTNAWLGTMVDYDNVLVVSSDMMEYWCSANIHTLIVLINVHWLQAKHTLYDTLNNTLNTYINCVY
jgi:hypothetical protein